MVQSLDHLVQGLDHLPQVTKRKQSKRDLHFDFWFNLAPLVDILVQKVFKKGIKRRSKKGPKRN